MTLGNKEPKGTNATFSSDSYPQGRVVAFSSWVRIMSFSDSSFLV